MAIIEQRLSALGLVLPPPVKPPPGVVLPFQFVRLSGNRALVSGHGPQNDDGSIAAPLGKLGGEITVEQGYLAARLTALSILAVSNARSATSTASPPGGASSAWSTRLKASINNPASSTGSRI